MKYIAISALVFILSILFVLSIINVIGLIYAIALVLFAYFSILIALMFMIADKVKETYKEEVQTQTETVEV